MSKATDRDPLPNFDWAESSPKSSPRVSSGANPESSLEMSPEITAEIHKGQREIARITRNNLFGHCHACEYEWVGSAPIACPQCGSDRVEFIACWQFPDD